MKRWTVILILLTLFFWSQSVLSMDWNVSSGFHFDWWEDTRDNKARQFHVPLSLEAKYQNFTFSLLTGYAYTYKDPDVGPTRSLGHLLDSKLKFSYEWIDRLPIDLLFGLDLNLPTGKTNLKFKELDLIMDPYLVSLSPLGEGFNVNPTLSIAKEWGKWVFGVGTGYLWRGTYDFGNIYEDGFSRIKVKNYEPGNIFSLTGEVRYDVTPNLQGRLYGNYFWYEKSKWKELGQTIFGFSEAHRRSLQEGELWLAGMGLSYRKKKWDGDLTFKGVFREKNKYDYIERWVVFDSTGFAFITDMPSLVRERRNSHGEEWVGDLSLKYFIDDKTTFKSFFQALFITKNDYPSFSLHYQGRREKYTLGFGLKRILIPHLEAEVYAKGFLMHDGERRFPHLFGGSQNINERHYKGFSGGVLLTGRF